MRFDNEKDIEAFISRAIKEALGTKAAVVRAANIFKEQPQENMASKVSEEQVVIKNIMSTIIKTTKKLKIGVVGGYRGMSMIKILLEHEDAELVAVCDKEEFMLNKVRETAKESNCELALFRNFDDFIEYDMDAVVLANYANEHVPFAIKCLNAGKHVFSEVLPCQTMKEAVELVEAVEKSGLVYAYGENYCYISHFTALRHNGRD